MFKVLLLLECVNVAFSCAAIGNGGEGDGGISDFAITNNPTFELHYRPPVKWTTTQTATPTLGQSQNLNSATKAAQVALRTALIRSLSKFNIPSSPLQQFNFNKIKGNKIDVFDSEANAENGGGIVVDGTVQSTCKKIKTNPATTTTTTAPPQTGSTFAPVTAETGGTTVSPNTAKSTSTAMPEVTGSTTDIGTTVSESTVSTTDSMTSPPPTLPLFEEPIEKLQRQKRDTEKCDSLDDFSKEGSFTLKNGPLLSGKQWKDIAGNMQDILTEAHVQFDDDIIVKA